MADRRGERASFSPSVRREPCRCRAYATCCGAAAVRAMRAANSSCSSPPTVRAMRVEGAPSVRSETMARNASAVRFSMA